jgi:hypothetical protein
VDDAAQAHLAGGAGPVPGTELLDHSLVDPDGRGAVDYGLRARLLEELGALAAAALPVWLRLRFPSRPNSAGLKRSEAA